MGAYVSPIKLRNCYAEIAILKLRIEIGGMQQQIGAMQRHAEIDSQQPGRHHRHPGCKISVMNVDVSNPSPLKAQRVIRPQPGVQYGAKPPERRFSSVNQHTYEQVTQEHAISQTEPNCPEELPHPQRLQI